MTNGSRERVLARVRAALADVPADEPVERRPSERPYAESHDAGPTLDVLVERLVDYNALVRRVAPDRVADEVAAALERRGARRILVPAGLPEEWLSRTSVERVVDSPEDPRDVAELDSADGVVTACTVAVAETGTIVLDGGPDQGRRRITLIPDHHVCVVRVPDQVVASVPRALERLDPTRPLTWISGPSATSDIELDRVEGVHGPRTLEVVLLTE